MFILSQPGNSRKAYNDTVRLGKEYTRSPATRFVETKRESLTPDEATIALAKIEEDFWASQTGQKLIRDRGGAEFSGVYSTGAGRPAERRRP